MVSLFTTKFSRLSVKSRIRFVSHNSYIRYKRMMLINNMQLEGLISKVVAIRWLCLCIQVMRNMCESYVSLYPHSFDKCIHQLSYTHLLVQALVYSLVFVLWQKKIHAWPEDWTRLTVDRVHVVEAFQDKAKKRRESGKLKLLKGKGRRKRRCELRPKVDAISTTWYSLYDVEGGYQASSLDS